MEFTLIETPLVLGSASLITFISVRSTSIADRIRTADKEIVDSATVQERRENLLLQVRALHHRYEADTYAMLALLLAFIAFVALGALATVSKPAAYVAFGIGMTAASIGFALTLYEVYAAKNTLLADIAYAEAVAKEQMPANKPMGC